MTTTDTTHLNPDDIGSAIRACANDIARGVEICSDAYRKFLGADRAYDLAFAKAYMAFNGAAHAKRYAAEIATTSERAARDQADVEYRYADRKAKALENELRALQSVGASVRTMYGAAGVN